MNKRHAFTKHIDDLIWFWNHSYSDLGIRSNFLGQEGSFTEPNIEAMTKYKSIEKRLSLLPDKLRRTLFLQYGPNIPNPSIILCLGNHGLVGILSKHCKGKDWAQKEINLINLCNKSIDHNLTKDEKHRLLLIKLNISDLILQAKLALLKGDS